MCGWLKFCKYPWVLGACEREGLQQRIVSLGREEEQPDVPGCAASRLLCTDT